MRHVVRTVAAIRFAWSTRRDLLLESLALRHQLGVLARSNRRFRPADRLLWLILRRVWPRWRDALVLVQPATVARWHRDGFYRCWRRRLRRLGRPRIDSQCRGLIRRLAAENRLWGAPRIHGELLKLGIAVTERTMSRYLPHRRTAPSQTWRTFLANHLGQFTFTSPETSLYAPGADDVGDVSGLTFRQTPLSAMGCTPLIKARSWSVLHFSGRHLARTSFKITFTIA
jgi:putative transposase